MKGNPNQSWIQDFMQWISYSRHWIPVFVNETWILDSTIVSGIPDSLSCIQDSKAQHFHFHKQNFPDPRIRIPLHVWVLTGRIFKSPRPAFLHGSWSWLPVLVSSQLDFVKKTGPLVAFISKNVHWLSSVPCTPYRRPLISLLTPHDMFLCPLTPCSYALLMNSHFLKVLNMETWFVEPRAKTNKSLACLFRVGYSSVKINKDFFVDRHQFFHK